LDRKIAPCCCSDGVNVGKKNVSILTPHDNQEVAFKNNFKKKQKPWQQH